MARALVMGDGVPCYGALEIVGLLLLLLLLLLVLSDDTFIIIIIIIIVSCKCKIVT